jgi:serralysin
MRFPRVLAVLGTILVLQACKHPLAIVGEGDIIDLNNSGYGCTLEQFQSGDPACSENEVSGDYYVNYRAEPRPGWRFVRWEGPCAQSSEFQHCRVDASADAVSWWDANVDTEIPPSTAVFEPVTGMTGYLADAPVAGVTYITPTQQGVTSANGSFHYLEGESIRFLIGSTLLGEVEGQERVTPFDLAGAAIVTGQQAEQALRDDEESFQAVVNISVLLQSLDRDADPSNGIEIPASVSALLEEVSLDVNQGWSGFQNDQQLRSVIARANKLDRFSVAHGLTLPATALNHLYQQVGIAAPTLALSREVSTEHNGEQGSSYSYYDGDGNLVRREAYYGQGALSEVEHWEYDERGYLIRNEAEASGAERSEKRYYNEQGKPTLYTVDEDGDGLPESRETWSYNSQGDLLRWEVDDESDGSLEYLARWHYQYDDNGRLTQASFESEAKGEEDEEDESAIANYQYDANDHLIRVDLVGGELDVAAEGLGIGVIAHLGLGETYSVTYQYDAQGNLTTEVRFGANQEMGSNMESYFYDDEGRLVRMESELLTTGPLPSGVGVTVYEYDENGYLVLQVTDLGNDGEPNLTTSYENDSYGNPLRVETEEELDDDESIIEVWVYLYEYDSAGNVVRREQMQIGGEEQAVFLYQYYADGVVALERKVVNESGYGHLSSWYYDSLGNAIREEHDEDGDGSVDRLVAYQYDDNGNVTRQFVDYSDANEPDALTTYDYDARHQLTDKELDIGADGALDAYARWRYDADGKLLRHEANCEVEGEELTFSCFEFSGSPFPGQSAEMYSYEYDEENDLEITTSLFDFDGDGIYERSSRIAADTEGRTVSHAYDEDGDGLYENMYSFAYHENGEVQRQTHTQDGNGDGVPDEVYVLEFNERGQLLRDTEDTNGDGVPERVETREYSADGERTEVDTNGDGIPDEISYIEFDAYGNLTREVEDENGDGIPEAITVIHREYDDDGNEVLEEVDEGDDGTLESTETVEYDGNGNILRLIRIENYDDWQEYIETNEYDASGNLVRKEVQHTEVEDEGEQRVELRVHMYTYDAAGNLISESETSDWDGDGTTDSSSSRHYQTAGWGHLFQ